MGYMENTDTTRVSKIIAHATGLSRREVDNAINAGRVTVNGTTAILGAQVGAADVVALDGKPVNQATDYTYLMLNKPVGYLSSRKSQGGDPTLYELLPESLRKLKTVGRLDRDSSGLIIMTDDGDFAHRMTHPKFSKNKFYEIELDRELQPLHQQMINDYGVNLEDGNSQLNLSRLSDDNRTQWQVSMHEGRNRQIRRTFSALGYTVIQLHRIQFGPYQLHDLASGKYSLVEKH